ncbi:MAG: hypothetical protein Q9224_006841 [Gallowayella concinna]
MVGINYINKDLPRKLRPTTLFDARRDDRHGVLEFLRMCWILEITPNKLGQGNYPDIQTAYISLVRDLKRRRALPLRRYESIELVRDYAACMNEISYLHEASEQGSKNLKALREYWSTIQNQTHSEPRNVAKEGKPGRKLSETLQQNMNLIQSNNEALPRLLTDLKSSLDVLFQLRTIEQNELAIIAESNSRAILVFTCVTIIFLPLSFFTSYFGMNLKGVVDTNRTERFFWAVCGTVTVCVVGFTVLFGFKERLYRWFWEDRAFVKERAR